MIDLQSITIADRTIQLRSDPSVWAPYSAFDMLRTLHQQGKFEGLENAHVLDFGTGSGIVGIFCGLMGAASITLLDYCEKAVMIAAENAKLNGLKDVTVIQSDRFSQLDRQDYDLIISNPPVQPWLYTDLSDQEHRPRVEAWNEAGADGRLVLDSLLKEGRQYLKPGGRLITSSSSRHGHRQTQALLNTYWPEQWQEIYAMEYPLLPSYHGPYLPSWQTMQVQDLDLRMYQKTPQDQPYAYQMLQGKGTLLTIADEVVTRWQVFGNRWVAVDEQGQEVVPQPAVVPEMNEFSVSSEWLYLYYLLEAVKSGN